jgi:hypothetical protein
MPNHESPPLLADRLFALARDQLKMQTARSTALEASSLGIMALDTALALLIDLAGRI